MGHVATAGDGIAHVTGLPYCMANELLTFEDGTLGLAFNLDAREIGVVILGDFVGIEEGQEVRRTGEVLSVPVGDGFLGRVVDPLGRPSTAWARSRARKAHSRGWAPDVMHRHPVDQPMSTGLKAIDAMTPIGRGQRQLIIGDRQTGKTAIAIDTIINQKKNWESGDPKKQVRCIYVAIGQKGSTIASVKQSPRGRRHGVHDNRRLPGLRFRRLQVHRAIHRLGHRPALDVQRQGCAHCVRRSVEAGRSLPFDLAAAASSAGA